MITSVVFLLWGREIPDPWDIVIDFTGSGGGLFDVPLLKREENSIGTMKKLASTGLLFPLLQGKVCTQATPAQRANQALWRRTNARIPFISNNLTNSVDKTEHLSKSVFFIRYQLCCKVSWTVPSFGPRSSDFLRTVRNISRVYLHRLWLSGKNKITTQVGVQRGELQLRISTPIEHLTTQHASYF